MRVIPFEGRMSYGFMRSLKMILDYRNDPYPLPFLECVSTSPFGLVYIFTDRGGFAVNGYNPHACVQRALDALHYKYEFKCFGSAGKALAFLRSALESDPVIIGPIDMGYRVYDPLHKFRVGGDHYVVALQMKEDHVIVNDPDGYPLARFPTDAFLKAY